MSERKPISKDIEADILQKSGRRCCLCYGLDSDFDIKQGQIAHLDRDPSNSNFDNLCFLCLMHHDEYDTRRSQSKGLTIEEVKRYRTNLYDLMMSWRDYQYASIFPQATNTPILDFYNETGDVVDKTSQGTQIIVQQSGITLADKDLSGKDGVPNLILSITFVETKSEDKIKKTLRLVATFYFGLTLRTEVHIWDDWGVFGFLNVLRNKVDIWILHGDSVKDDQRDPVYHARDFLLIYRKDNGGNSLVISTHTLTSGSVQIQALFSENVANALADHLEKIGFATPFDQ